MKNWALHLRQLEFILQEFDEKGVLEESDFIRFFRKDFRLLIKAQIKWWGREDDSWKEFVKKTIDAKTKASLQPQSIICKIDQRCPYSN